MSQPRPKKLSPAAFQQDLRTTTLPTSGHTYSYHLSLPSSSTPSPPTIILIHGFPDLAFGWRNQIPHLTSLGFRVVVPNMLGYSNTSAPADPKYYTYKSLSHDVHELLVHIGVDFSNGERVIVGGHDWGGALAWRFGMWFPDDVRGIFTACTPFSPPVGKGHTFKHPGEMVSNFRYQIQFAGREVEEGLSDEVGVRSFLAGMIGGRSTVQVEGAGKEKGRPKQVFAVETGVDVPVMKAGQVGNSPLLEEKEMEFYVQQYMLHNPPLQGPLNWYRVHELNFNDERDAGWGGEWRGGQGGRKWEIPGLWVAGKRDKALPPIMGRGMEKWWRDGKDEGNAKGKKALRVREVDANHWALWERAGEVNAIVEEWLGDIFGAVGSGGEKAKL